MTKIYSTTVSDVSNLNEKQREEVELIIGAARILGCAILETVNNHDMLFFRVSSPNDPRQLAIVFRIKQPDNWISVFNNYEGEKDFKDAIQVNFQEAYGAVSNYF